MCTRWVNLDKVEARDCIHAQQSIWSQLMAESTHDGIIMPVCRSPRASSHAVEALVGALAPRGRAAAAAQWMTRAGPHIIHVRGACPRGTPANSQNGDVRAPVQGDGTASILEGHPHITTVSFHAASNFPYRKQRSTLDVPLPDGMADDEYMG